MKRSFLLTILVILMAGAASGQVLRKERLFKVDPMSGLFKEIRVAVEHRAFDEFFWYISPYGYHQSWMSKQNERWGRPEHPQKYYGVGLRLGFRRYFLPAGESPRGLFLHGMLGLRHTWVNNLNNSLEITDKTNFQQIGLGATVGYQWLHGGWAKDNIAFGFMGGFEYYPLAFYRAGYDKTNFTRNWYELPFLGNFLNGFRIYLGVEIGFAFLQKNLHW